MHFTDWETEAQRGIDTCPRLYTVWERNSQDWNSVLPGSNNQGFNHYTTLPWGRVCGHRMTPVQLPDPALISCSAFWSHRQHEVLGVQGWEEAGLVHAPGVHEPARPTWPHQVMVYMPTDHLLIWITNSHWRTDCTRTATVVWQPGVSEENVYR